MLLLSLNNSFMKKWRRARDNFSTVDKNLQMNSYAVFEIGYFHLYTNILVLDIRPKSDATPALIGSWLSHGWRIWSDPFGQETESANEFDSLIEAIIHLLEARNFKIF